MKECLELFCEGARTFLGNSRPLKRGGMPNKDQHTTVIHYLCRFVSTMRNNAWTHSILMKRLAAFCLVVMDGKILLSYVHIIPSIFVLTNIRSFWARKAPSILKFCRERLESLHLEFGWDHQGQTWRRKSRNHSSLRTGLFVHKNNVNDLSIGHTTRYPQKDKGVCGANPTRKASGSLKFIDK